MWDGESSESMCKCHSEDVLPEESQALFVFVRPDVVLGQCKTGAYLGEGLDSWDLENV
jgi:hypothetical protein